MTTIEKLRAKHKKEIEELQANCPHKRRGWLTYQKRLICVDCEKTLGTEKEK